MTDPKTFDPTATSTSIPPMSEQAFSAWGVELVAYVKPLIVSERPVYAIHAADGRQMAVAETFELAAATILQNDLQPVSVH